MNKSINESNLNREQFERLKELYVDTVVDSMNMEDLLDYVRNDYYNCVDKLTYNEVINEINYTLDESMLDEFITTIKQYSKD